MDIAGASTGHFPLSRSESLSALLRYRKRPAQTGAAARGDEWATDRLSAIMPRDTFRFGQRHPESEGTDG